MCTAKMSGILDSMKSAFNSSTEEESDTSAFVSNVCHVWIPPCV